MPIVPMTPPQPVAIYSGFDYMTVDAERGRVYAAHTGSQSLLIVSADSGKELGQVQTGPLHGVAVDQIDALQVRIILGATDRDRLDRLMAIRKLHLNQAAGRLPFEARHRRDHFIG